MITENDIKEYIRVDNEFNKLCEKWAEINLRAWQRYWGANIMSNGKTVCITYTYDEFDNNTDMRTEYDDICVSLSELLKLQENGIEC